MIKKKNDYPLYFYINSENKRGKFARYKFKLQDLNSKFVR